MFELTFNAYTFSLFIAFVIAMAFAVLLIAKPHSNGEGNFYLAGVIVIIALWNASILVLALDIYRYAIGIIWVPLTYTLAIGPCYYFYVKSLTQASTDNKSRLWPHFIPVILEVLVFLFEVFQGIPMRLGYFQTPAFRFFDPLVTFAAIASCVAYAYYSKQLIVGYHRWVKNNFSHYHRYNLEWLVRFNAVFSFFFAIWLVYFVVDFFVYDYALTFLDYVPFHLTLAVISIWLSVEVFYKPILVYPEQNIEIKSEAEPPKAIDKDLKLKAEWLKTQIEENALYLDPELSLQSLAKILDCQAHTVSNLINLGLDQTFSDLINDYRVQAVMRKIQSNKSSRTNFLAIAFASGFNSKSTFNRVFKNKLGVTPLQYQKNWQKSQI